MILGTDLQQLVLAAVWFGLPAGMANMMPIIAAKLFPRFTYPMDGFRMVYGKRALGDHKTVRGLVFGVLAGALTFLIQQESARSNPAIAAISWIPYGETPWYLGAFFGLGAILGDAAKSFAKRQIGIAPGKSWFPFDQSDWIAGMLIAISPWVRLPAGNVISLFIIGITMHLLSKVIGKALHLNSTYI